MLEKIQTKRNNEQPFQLLGHFRTVSFAAFILVGVLLVTLYRQIAVAGLLEVGESKNLSITRSFSNVIWPEYSAFLNDASNMSVEEIRNHPETARLRQAVLDQMQGLTVIKVKIYTLNGKTVFSTEENQIGEDKKDNAGFLMARDGNAATELTHRDTFSAFEGELEDRDVISSYVPIQRSISSEVEAVIEVYDDVTPLLQSISTNQRNIAFGITLILILLYTALYLMVRRSDQLIRKQFYEQKDSEAAIKQAHAQEEKINDFFHFTLLNIIGYVERGTEKTELLAYLEQIKGQFDELKYWVNDKVEK